MRGRARTCVVWMLAIAHLLTIAPSAALSAVGDPQAPETTEETPEHTRHDPLFDEPDPLFDDDFELDEPPGFPDPLEETNRGVLKFNQVIDRAIISPVTKVFGFLVPNPVKFALRRFFANLDYPVVFVNDVLQLEWKDATMITGAFVVNSTVGLAGLFEPARHIGLPRHHSDFGQTLALAEVESGPYLMIPIVGPTTARDFTGTVVDIFMRPTTYAFGLGALLYVGGERFMTLEEAHEGLVELERSSVDFYPVLRSAYYQNRISEIWNRRDGRRPIGPDGYLVN
jgi:phospholipid-binding lipoprotein MlaA